LNFHVLALLRRTPLTRLSPAGLPVITYVAPNLLSELYSLRNDARSGCKQALQSRAILLSRCPHGNSDPVYIQVSSAPRSSRYNGFRKSCFLSRCAGSLEQSAYRNQTPSDRFKHLKNTFMPIQFHFISFICFQHNKLHN